MTTAANDSERARSGTAAAPNRRQRRAVVATFVVASALINLVWFLVTLPPYPEPFLFIFGAVCVYGQGSLFALGLWAARRWARAAAVGPSRRTLAGVALGQPAIVIATGLLAAFISPGLQREVSLIAYFIASVLGCALVAWCLDRETSAGAESVVVAMLGLAVAWAVVPTAISRGWDVGALHLGVFGGPSDRVLHPLVTALWQIPMAGLVAGWLIGVAPRRSFFAGRL